MREQTVIVKRHECRDPGIATPQDAMLQRNAVAASLNSSSVPSGSTISRGYRAPGRAADGVTGGVRVISGDQGVPACGAQ